MYEEMLQFQHEFCAQILSTDDFTCDLSQFDVLDPPKSPPPDRVTERLRERIPRQTSDNQTLIISPVLQLVSFPFAILCDTFNIYVLF